MNKWAIFLICCVFAWGCATGGTVGTRTADEEKGVETNELNQLIAGFNPDSQDIGKITDTEASAYYEKLWAYLYVHTQGKPASAQLEMLTPWVTRSDYQLSTLEEKLFLSDVFTWAAVSHQQTNDLNRASISYLTAGAILHSTFDDLKSRFMSSLGEMDTSSLAAMQQFQRQMEASKRTYEQSADNVKRGKSILSKMGRAAYQTDRLGFLQQVFKAQKEDEETKKALLERVAGELKELSTKEDTYKDGCINLLVKLFADTPDSWPALQALNLFPDSRPMKSIVLMPRFYDYEGDIREYLGLYKEESIALAESWLANADASNMEKARAFYVLGVHQTPWSTPDAVVPDLGDLNIYKWYYDIRIDAAGENPDTQTVKDKLIQAASAKNESALVLYDQIRKEGEASPPGLVKWLNELIDEKKYSDGEVLHIFRGTISGLPDAAKNDCIDRMYNAYNSSWQDVATVFYEDAIPEDISENAIKWVLVGNVPWKKVTLINWMAEHMKPSYEPLIADFLIGKYYTKGDQEIIKRNVENMYTKDVTLGYNEQLNWTAVNEAVDSTEKRFRSLMIYSASDALNALSFDSAASVISKRFLNDDILCIAGAQWLAENYKAAENKKPTLPPVSAAATDLQKAVLAFLTAYFSPQADYASYIKQTNDMKTDDDWSQLIGLGTVHVSNKMFAGQEQQAIYYNPVTSTTLDGVVSNIKTRYLAAVSSESNTEKAPAEEATAEAAAPDTAEPAADAAEPEAGATQQEADGAEPESDATQSEAVNTATGTDSTASVEVSAPKTEKQ